MFIDRTAIKSTAATCAQKLDPHITHITRHNNMANEFRAGQREGMMVAAPPRLEIENGRRKARVNVAIAAKRKE